VFALTAPYIVYLLKVHCYYVSLGKFCTYDTCGLFFYRFIFKVKVKIRILKMKSLLGFQVKIQDLDYRCT